MTKDQHRITLTRIDPSENSLIMVNFLVLCWLPIAWWERGTATGKAKDQRSGVLGRGEEEDGGKEAGTGSRRAESSDDRPSNEPKSNLRHTTTCLSRRCCCTQTHVRLFGIDDLISCWAGNLFFIVNHGFQFLDPCYFQDQTMSYNVLRSSDCESRIH